MNAVKENIQKYIQAYIEDPDARYAILITGQWGSGKTFFIKKWIQSAQSSNKKKDKKDTGTISLKPIYVSLNGISTVNGFYRAIWKQIFPILNTQLVASVKNLLGGAIKIASQCFIDLNGDGQTDDISGSLDVESFIGFLLENDRIINRRILVFDDLERCSIPIEQQFGILNQFTEHLTCKVILVANEDRLKAKKEEQQYEVIKEKLIGQTLKFDIEITDAVKDIIAGSKDKVISDNEDLIIDVFNTSALHNLRSLKTSLQSFSIFRKLINKEFEENNAYPEFIKNVLTYFLICSFELAAGNTEIRKYQSLEFEVGQSDKEDDKYSRCLAKHKLYSSIYSVPVAAICQFLSDGYKDDFDDIIRKNMFFKNATQKEWERLWDYYGLENEDFKRYVSVVKDNIAHCDMANIPTLLHSVGILLKLNQERLIRINKKQLLAASKKTVKKIIASTQTPRDESVCFMLEAAYGRAYTGSKISEFKDFLNYCIQERKNLEKDFTRQTCKRIWENLTDESIEQVKQLIPQWPEILGEKGNDGIFSGVNLHSCVNKIVSLNNAAREELSEIFFAYQNSQSITDAERMCMRKLSAKLKTKSKNLVLVDKASVLFLVQAIERCCAKERGGGKGNG